MENKSRRWTSLAQLIPQILRDVLRMTSHTVHVWTCHLLGSARVAGSSDKSHDRGRPCNTSISHRDGVERNQEGHRHDEPRIPRTTCYVSLFKDVRWIRLIHGLVRHDSMIRLAVAEWPPQKHGHIPMLWTGNGAAYHGSPGTTTSCGSHRSGHNAGRKINIINPLFRPNPDQLACRRFSGRSTDTSSSRAHHQT